VTAIVITSGPSWTQIIVSSIRETWKFPAAREVYPADKLSHDGVNRLREIIRSPIQAPCFRGRRLLEARGRLD
jgi:hypothetical protein